MKFINIKLQAQLLLMAATGKLFTSSFTGKQVWEMYLTSFKDDPIYRDPESSSHNCNTCNSFMKRYGNIIAIDANNNIMTLFDLEDVGEYEDSFNNLSEALKQAPIANVFVETYTELNSLPYEKCTKSQDLYQLGIVSNLKRYDKIEAEKFGRVKENEIVEFHHLNVQMPSVFIDQSGKSKESIQADYRSAKEVFKRAMDEIPVDTLILVRDLIIQGSLLNGNAHLHKLEAIIPLMKEYENLNKNQEDNWCWLTSYKFSFAKFRNELIGVLCKELAEGVELNKACLSWNKRVDPANYMKASAPITQRQIEEAKKFIQENDYEDSFDRRFANLEDIKVDDIQHVNVGDGKIASVSIFDKVKSTSTRHKRAKFEDVEEVDIEKFMKDILPNCTSIEAFLENTMEGHMMSLTTANNTDSKPIFNWNNNYSWTYNGNLTGKSQLRDAVVSKGGRVDGVFRFSHSWNELERNQSLMDLHVFMPGNNHIEDGCHDKYGSGRRVGWNQRTDYHSRGNQDVDHTAQAPAGHIPVENITFPELAKMPDGQYICKIHNWSFRNSGGKGKAEIEFEGNIFQYVYPATKHKEWITVAIVTLEDGRFSIEHKLPTTSDSKVIYGLDTQNFHKVNLLCLSPNYWGENKVGNKHYFFMLDKCIADNTTRSFHNENLISELRDHRKVMEVLASSTMIESKGKQLSGIGFNATVKDELIVKVKGSFQRILKIKF